MTVRRKLIRRLTQDIRSKNNVEAAPVDVFGIAHGLGLEIREERTKEELSGFLFRNQKENVAVIGVNSMQSPVRQRFTVAHEIGHFMLHSDDRLHVDKGYEVKLRDQKSKEGTEIDEMEANLFAAELLMPEDFLARDIAEMGSVDLNDEKALKGLAGQYKVSSQALAFRLAYLGYA
jgi:Zn-dependent peptidase ImmA (M78 family)